MAHETIAQEVATNAFELGIDSEKLAGIIEKARMFDAKEEVSDPDSGSNASDDDMRDILEDLADDSTRQELIHLIRDLQCRRAVQSRRPSLARPRNL